MLGPELCALLISLSEGVGLVEAVVVVDAVDVLSAGVLNVMRSERNERFRVRGRLKGRTDLHVATHAGPHDAPVLRNGEGVLENHAATGRSEREAEAKRKSSERTRKACSPRSDVA